MPEINRYTQMPQPLLVNPISFEEFSRVPMAQAVEKGAGIAAINRIQTDFDVDESDLGKVTEMVSGLDQIKNDIVTRITTNNINSQTVNDVLNLKRQRDDLYKTKINAAELNKKIINNFRENVDRETASGTHPPDWGELIKAKGYQEWVNSGGTFGTDGQAKTFIPNFGVKYINEDKDIQQVIDYASQMSQQSRTDTPSGFGLTNIGGIGFSFNKSAGWSETWSNEQKLNYAKEMLKAEYANPSTERGKYVQYGERDLAVINKKIDDYYNMRLMKEKKQELGQTHIGGAIKGDEGKSTQSDYTPSYDKLFERRSKYQMDPDIAKTSESGILSEIGTAIENTLVKPIKGNITLGSTAKNLFNYFSDFIDNMKNTTDSNKARLALIKKYGRSINEMVNQGIISKNLANMAITGRGEQYVEDVYDKLKEFQRNISSVMESPELDTKDYTYTFFGVGDPKIKSKEAAADWVKGGYQLYDIENRSTIDKKEMEELRLKALNGKAVVEGNIPMLSPDLLDENGNYIEGMSSALQITDTETGKKYYTPLKSSLRDERTNEGKNFARIEEINKTLLTLPGANKTSMLYYDPTDGIFKQIDIIANDAKKGTFLYQDEQGVDYDLTPDMLTRMYGPKFFKTYLEPQLLKASKEQNKK